MSKIQLTQNKYALVDDEDFDELNQHKWCCGKNKYTYYVMRKDSKLKKVIYMHRVIMNQQHNLHVDHINRNGLDNRKENLRVCTKTQNLGNSKIRKDSTSGIKGISWHKRDKKWGSRININGKLKHLGYFSDKFDAKHAYTKAAKEYFGEFYSEGILNDKEVVV